jgi:hypothetical protein
MGRVLAICLVTGFIGLALTLAFGREIMSDAVADFSFLTSLALVLFGYAGWWFWQARSSPDDIRRIKLHLDREGQEVTAVDWRGAHRIATSFTIRTYCVVLKAVGRPPVERTYGVQATMFSTPRVYHYDGGSLPRAVT